MFSFFYFYLGFPIIFANLISWFVAVTGSYVMNSMTTFAVELGMQVALASYATFLLAQVAGLVANTATVYLVPIVIGKIMGIDRTSTTLVLDRQAARDRVELPGQLFTVALRGLPASRAADQSLDFRIFGGRQRVAR